MRSVRIQLAWQTVMALVAITVAGSAFAQIEEVIVRAQKREQNIQEVPIAVSAFSAEEIREYTLRDMGDVLNFVPNAVRASGPSTTEDAFFFFRGVGQVDNSTNVDPGVGVYIDEVYLGRIQGASFDVLDISSIEVLRGPQGTLFGRNTIGGAVSVHTRDPGEEFAMRGRATVGSRNQFDAWLSADVPLADNSAVTASVFALSQDGWAENTYTGEDYGRRDDVGGRFKLVVDATEDLTFKLAGDWTDGQGTPIPTVLLGSSSFQAPQCLPPGAPPGTPFFGSPLCVSFPADYSTEIDSDPFDNNVFGSASMDQSTERGGLSLTIEAGFDTWSVKSITAYRAMDQQTYTDLDGSQYSFYDFGFGVDQDQLSQELQFSGNAFDDRAHWLVGAYYFEEDIHNNTLAGVGTNTAFPTPPGVPFPFPFLPGPAQRQDGRALKFHSNLNLDVESTAVFGQLEFDFTDRLSGIAGFRYTDEEKTYEFDNASDNRDFVWNPLSFIPFPPGIAPVAPLGQIMYTLSCRPGSNSEILGGPCMFSADWDNFSPKLGVNYRFSPQAMAYVSWSNGFKSGGFGGRATPGNIEEPYDPEEIETYEIGLKSQFLDNRVRLNAAAFMSDYSDIQLLVLEIVNGTPQFNTRNAGASDIAGFEVELIASPADPIDLYFNVGWLDNEYDELAPGAAVQGIDLTDSLPNAPEWTWAAGGQYTFDLGGSGEVAVRADYNWRDDFYFQAANRPGDLEKSYGLLNLRATYRAPNGNLYMALFGKNVTDEEYFLTRQDQRTNLGVWLGVPAPGTEWGLELGFSY